MPITLTKEHLIYMGIGSRYWDAKRSSFSPRQLKLMSSYLKTLDKSIYEGNGLFLCGENSSGKTYIASTLCKTVWGLYRVASYLITAPNLYGAWIKDSEAHPGSDETICQRVAKVRFLVIDDAGREYRTHSGFSETQFGALLRDRSRERKTTVITTNLMPKEFADIYGKAAGELAKECFDVVHLSEGGLRERKVR